MVNKVILIGNVGQEPQVKDLDNGNKIVNFSLATSERYTNREGEKVEETEWHNCVCFGKTADIAAQYVEKGKKLYIEGQLKTRSWEAEDGSMKYKTEVNVRNLTFVSGKNESQQEPAHAGDDMPF
jgi:single-strand DNA-binding protein